MFRSKVAHHIGFLLCLLPGIASAAKLPSQFTLNQYVPEGPWLYIHHVQNPDRDWIDRKWSEVFDALKATGVADDLVKLVGSVIDADSREKAKIQIQKASTLIDGVRWRDLGDREFVFTERYSSSEQSGLSCDYLVLMRGKDGTAEANVRGLGAILKEIATLAGRSVSETKLQDVEVWSLPLAAAQDMPFPFTVELFRKGDVIGVTTNKRLLAEVVSLMHGDAKVRAISENPRFQQALSEVEAPRDGLVYFDARSFVTDMRGMMAALLRNEAEHKKSNGKQGSKNLPGEGPIAKAALKVEKDAKEEQGESDDLKPEQVATLIQKVFDLVDFSDFTITSVETKGRRELSHSVWKIQDGKQNAPLAKVILNRKPFERFDQYIPAEATGFGVSSSVDLEQLYNLIIDFVGKELPGGTEVVSQIKTGFASVGFDPQRDIFSWWSGEVVSMEMPAAIASPMGGADWVLMIRVKDGEVASTKVNGFLDMIAARLKAEGQMLMLSPAKVNATGFREITHPYMAMFLKPVLGVSGNWLMLGSNAGAINKCLDVAAGKGPSIVENRRFKEEGLIPKGPVSSVSFRDTSHFGQELAAGAGMIGMLGGIAIAGFPEHDADSKQGKQILQSALATVMKLGPVLQKIDFYSSEASMTTYDGKLTLRTEKVVTYKASSNPVDEKGSPKAPAPPVPPTPPPAPK